MEVGLVLAGAVTGFLVGLTGVGGGALMTPILLLAFGLPPMTAVGTDLWFAALTKLFASRVHNRHDLVDWVVVKRLWSGSLPASVLMLLVLHALSLRDQEVLWLMPVLATAIGMTGCGMLLHAQLHAACRHQRIAKADRFKRWQAPLTVLAGVVLGVLVSLTSVGAGALGAVFLGTLYPLRLTPARLVATDIVHAIPLSLFAGLGHFALGNIDASLLLLLLLGSIPAVMLGASLSAHIPHGILRMLLGSVLSLIALQLWFAYA